MYRINTIKDTDSHLLPLHLLHTLVIRQQDFVLDVVHRKKISPLNFVHHVVNHTINNYRQCNRSSLANFHRTVNKMIAWNNLFRYRTIFRRYLILLLAKWLILRWLNHGKFNRHLRLTSPVGIKIFACFRYSAESQFRLLICSDCCFHMVGVYIYIYVSGKVDR